jgi:uncharacterized protein YdgA (DUF945 family)
MKKYLLPVVIIVAVTISILIGAPFTTGMMAEKQYHSMIRENPFKPILRLESRNFERGFFSSQATTWVEVADPALRETVIDNLGMGKNGKPGILIHHHLSHGPLIFGDGQGINFAIANATHHVEQNNPGQNSEGVDLFQLDTSLHFDGSQTIEINSREISTKNEKATTTLMPISALFVTDKSYRTMKGRGDWKGMISKSNRGEILTLSDILFEFDAEKSGEMWFGNISLTQSSMALESPKETFQMDRLKIESRSSEHDGHLIDSAAQISFQQVKAVGKTYGPGELNLAINNISATALERLGSIQKRAINASSSNETFALQATGFEALSLLPELLSHGIVIDMKRLYLNTPDGEVIGRFHFSLPKSNPSSLMNISYLKSIIDLDFRLSLPVVLIPEATMKTQIQPLLNRGYLKIDGRYLKSEIQMSAGVITINDRVISLPY